MNIRELKEYKKTGEKITCLTAYDASFAKVLDGCGIDIILVGDSLGGVIQGDENTLSVTMDDMLYHSRIVAQSVKNSLIVVDMPYKSYANAKQAVSNAKRLIATGAHMVKLEGGREYEEVFLALRDNNIAVCGHLGLQPQSVLEIGGYKVQGRDKENASKIIEDAQLLESCGVEVFILECIPSVLAAKISASLTIPTIGIGAGVDCDGQVLVIYDLLGISGQKIKFVKNFLINNEDIYGAVKGFIKAVKNNTFPDAEHSY